MISGVRAAAQIGTSAVISGDRRIVETDRLIARDRIAGGKPSDE